VIDVSQLNNGARLERIRELNGDLIERLRELRAMLNLVDNPLILISC